MQDYYTYSLCFGVNSCRVVWFYITNLDYFHFFYLWMWLDVF